jgi:tetratricopeptide (TPR) repeat protein
MSDDSADRIEGASNVNALLAATLGTVSDNPRVDRLLDHQVTLTELQIDNLRKQDEYEVSHLRWRRFNDQMKGAMQIMLVLVGALIVIGIGVTLWSAAHEDGVVIEAFSVPPDMAAKGITGQAIAAQLQDRLTTMQNTTNSARPAASYSNNWGDDIKVDIPDTGISVSEFYRLLVSRLGNQTHITGEVWRNADGIAITARAKGASAVVAGKESDIDTLLQKSAEAIYRHTQPYRFAVYLMNTAPQRESEAVSVFDELALHGTPTDRVWAHIGLGIADDRHGNFAQGISEFKRASEIDPDHPLPWVDLYSIASTLSHDEDEVRYTLIARRTFQQDSNKASAAVRTIYLSVSQAETDEDLGDHISAYREFGDTTQLPDANFQVERALINRALVLAELHDGSARSLKAEWPAFTSLPKLFARIQAVAIDYALSDYRAATAPSIESDVFASSQGLGFGGSNLATALSRRVIPFVAMSAAKLGDFKRAHALIDSTPRDCDNCLRARGVIATEEKNWAAADYWFTQATTHAPSIPFGYSLWGAMLLAKGDNDGAIAKFAATNKLGPHFADPLEMWGEALIAKNRSDLAVAKFAEAAKYAPNWGRLHLKWGEALWWSGDKDGARKQFAIAAALDLSPPEKAELAKVRHG